MKTKRIIKIIASTILVACMCTFFASCSKDAQPVNEQTSVKTDSKASESKKPSIKRNKEPDEFGIVVSAEIFDADIFSNKLQLGNSVFTFPKIPVSEFIAANATFENEGTEDKIIKPNDSRNSKVIIDGKTYSFRFINFSDEDKPLKDCTAVLPADWSVNERNRKLGEDYICPMGIRVGSSLDDLLAAYGEPTYKDETTYYYVEDLVSCPASGYISNLIYEENGIQWYDIHNQSFKFEINPETNTIKSILYNCPDEFVPEKSIDETDKVSNKKAHFTAHMALPEYFKQVDNTAYCLVETNDKTLLVRAAYSVSNAYMLKTEMTEYSAESLDKFFEEINSGYAPDRDTISYDYRINDDTAYLYYYSIKDNDYGKNGEVTIYYLNENFDTLKWISISVFPCNGETDFSFDDFTSVRNVLDEMADSMELNIEYLE